MTIIRFSILLAACLVFPVMASGQMPGMGPWWDRPIARDLGLSEDQNRQIRAVVRESRDHLIQLRAAVQSAEADLRDEMDQDKVDSGKTEASIDKVVAARSELMRAVSMMTLKLRLALTADQWRELQRRQARPPGGPGARRPGMGGVGRKP